MAIDPQLAPFIARLEEAWPEPPLSLPVDVWRERIERLSAAARVPYPDNLAVETRTIDGPRPVRIRIYRPRASSPLPALIYMHGGGWVVGSIDSHDAITAALAMDTPCVVISIDYTRAPEHPFPAAVDDCRAVVAWTFDHAAELGIAADAIAVGGDSAGGNLAAAMTLAFRGSSRRIRGQLLLYPCVDVDFSRASYASEAHAPYLKAAEMIWFWRQYCPDEGQRASPLAVPMTEPNLAGLPDAFIVVAEHDPLRDEGQAYAERLRAAGVPVLFRPGRGLIHGFLRARTFSAAAEAEHQAMTSWLRSLPDRPGPG
ncbi:alpha/beta hydrolase [Bradyrhizobium sp. U87765 SZCCT0131]|uniref:alpha/beta hydrolase n=1 Tax=unclassified Bradyrhizobium TaxID=2631580 RepID=UPI001BAD2545|nr:MULTISPECIES: alpha/beta hydrolase [unclassified Bradyrhizobium]MBR1221606.1 alpha/beta hydrolase [Bradyrhizobium sp. U87765 SZCCT0131]MBR1264471.1 alpha/beta hydrolase [Bradyrhizobium sp. U87765 SZCCT0134]MBR1304622.1 alpha/beta hydrolase [Bradyrhizobium sp. U87765 SZCCT0110]MBR1322521.1 alpha/beta hydrolase [Bradyrhizobium sp. U87765 SZCCT0109]MBR1346551.1 alpha/beta hydrolase [Bradyrhizobium sp. U87765 SZCCT0048]